MTRCYVYDIADEAVVAAVAPPHRIERAGDRVAFLFDDQDLDEFDANQPAGAIALYTVEDGGRSGLAVAIPAAEWTVVLDAKATGTKAEIVAALDAAVAVLTAMEVSRPVTPDAPCGLPAVPFSASHSRHGRRARRCPWTPRLPPAG